MIFDKKQMIQQVWIAFVNSLQTGNMASIKIRPYHPALMDPLHAILQNMASHAIWEEWVEPPEVHSVGDQVHFLIGLTLGQSQDRYCFSFLRDNEAWYFQHVECITLRLDQLGPLPAHQFPDLPLEKKDWMREEIRISEIVRLFGWLMQEKGRDFALNWFKDGAGYFLAARAWVPFVSARRAFILYLCWEQARLRGSEVNLIDLSDEFAHLNMKPLYFDIFQRAGHLKQQISFDDYRALFETLWTDRALKAGWMVTFQYQDDRCEMRFQRVPDGGG